jgi:hypothetical protein
MRENFPGMHVVCIVIADLVHSICRVVLVKWITIGRIPLHFLPPSYSWTLSTWTSRVIGSANR